jgi:hypothetical protein
MTPPPCRRAARADCGRCGHFSRMHGSLTRMEGCGRECIGVERGCQRFSITASPKLTMTQDVVTRFDQCALLDVKTLTLIHRELSPAAVRPWWFIELLRPDKVEFTPHQRKGNYDTVLTREDEGTRGETPGRPRPAGWLIRQGRPPARLPPCAREYRTPRPPPAAAQPRCQRLDPHPTRARTRLDRCSGWQEDRPTRPRAPGPHLPA